MDSTSLDLLNIYLFFLKRDEVHSALDAVPKTLFVSITWSRRK
jgi:hypothetical protein